MRSKTPLNTTGSPSVHLLNDSPGAAPHVLGVVLKAGLTADEVARRLASTDACDVRYVANLGGYRLHAVRAQASTDELSAVRRAGG